MEYSNVYDEELKVVFAEVGLAKEDDEEMNDCIVAIEEDSEAYNIECGICNGICGDPELEGFFEECRRMEKILRLSYRQTIELLDNCKDCIYYGSLHRGDEGIACQVVRPRYFLPIIETMHCRWKKTSLDVPSEYELRRQRYLENKNK